MWIQLFKRHLLLSNNFLYSVVSSSTVSLSLFLKPCMTGGGHWPWISHMVSLSSFHTTWYNFFLLTDLFKVLFSKYLYFCVVSLLEVDNCYGFFCCGFLFFFFFWFVCFGCCCCFSSMLNLVVAVSMCLLWTKLHPGQSPTNQCLSYWLCLKTETFHNILMRQSCQLNRRNWRSHYYSLCCFSDLLPYSNAYLQS